MRLQDLINLSPSVSSLVRNYPGGFNREFIAGALTALVHVSAEHGAVTLDEAVLIETTIPEYLTECEQRYVARMRHLPARNIDIRNLLSQMAERLAGGFDVIWRRSDQNSNGVTFDQLCDHMRASAEFQALSEKWMVTTLGGDTGTTQCSDLRAHARGAAMELLAPLIDDYAAFLMEQPENAHMLAEAS